MRRLLLNILLVTVLSACSTDIPQGADPPSSFNLLLPENQQICEPGGIINGPNASLVFTWERAQGATSYDLGITDTSGSIIEINDITEPSYKIDLKRGESYSWGVLANNALYQVASSTSFHFYLRGEPVSNLVPTPPSAIYPKSGQSIAGDFTSIQLEWEGYDPDGDELSYHLTVEYSSAPNDTFTNLVDQTNLKGTNYTIQISPNTFYSWTVVASDGKDTGKSQSCSFRTTPN